MNPEQRFERIEATLARIADRHGAMARTVDILAGMQRENEKRFSQVTHNFEIELDSIRSLERTAAAHNDRRDDPEDQH